MTSLVPPIKLQSPSKNSTNTPTKNNAKVAPAPGVEGQTEGEKDGAGRPQLTQRRFSQTSMLRLQQEIQKRSEDDVSSTFFFF